MSPTAGLSPDTRILSSMLLIVLRVIYLSVCAGVIATYIEGATRTLDGVYPEYVREKPIISFVVMLLITQCASVVDLLVRRKRIEIISSVYFGLIVGVILAFMLIQAIIHVVPEEYKPVVVMFPLLILPYICVSLILQTKDDFRFVIPYVEFARDLKGTRPLVVDSSSLIDGRIADVVETDIIEAQLVVPDFVLSEIQEIADSSDKNRRLRGRRGLDVIGKLKESTKVEVTVHEERGDSESHAGLSIDQRLVALAQELSGGVITNDFNLNKVASVQGVRAVNLNDLANALKPRYIPGERLQIRVMKEGESNGQGIGYLDDGTMVVCENADHLIGEHLSVTVTSVLQKSEGRMIFGKPSDQTDV